MIKQLNVKKVVTVFLIMLVMMPALAFAGGNGVQISKVYFEDAQGRLVFVDYEEATRLAMAGDEVLYNALKHHVGLAEKRMKRVFLETDNGVVLNYQKALTTNKFRLSEILNDATYLHTAALEYSHELILRDGVAVIENANRVELVSITPVPSINVPLSTPRNTAISMLNQTTTLVDQNQLTHTVNIQWTLPSYDLNTPGSYLAIGTFSLPEGMLNPRNIALEVRTPVVVMPAPETHFPEEVLEVVIGTSAITGRTYANVQIKPAFVSLVNAVKIDGVDAMQNDQNMAQWRLEVAQGTSLEDLFGKVVVTRAQGQVFINWSSRVAGPFLPMIRHLTVHGVSGLTNATHYDVTYQLSGGEEVTCTRVAIGQETEGLFFNGIISSTLRINLYDQTGRLLHMENVTPQ